MPINNFKPWKTNCSFDMPQELWREKDFFEIEIKRKGEDESEFENLCEIDWREIIGWRYSE